MNWPETIENIALFAGAVYLIVAHGFSPWWLLVVYLISNKNRGAK